MIPYLSLLEKMLTAFFNISRSNFISFNSFSKALFFRLLKPLKKMPDILTDVRNNLNKDKFDSVNIYCQDETRVGLTWIMQ